jgi:hypothetical protein
MLIRPEEMKYLLKNLPVISAACESMKRGFEALAEDVDGDIYSACMNGPVTGGGLPGPGAISDKTGRIAMEYRYSSRDNIKKLQKDVSLLANVVESIEAGKKVLTKIQKAILNLRYPGDSSETPWKDVTAELNISVSHIRKIFDYSITRIISAAQISVDTYQEVVQIMDGRGA